MIDGNDNLSLPVIIHSKIDSGALVISIYEEIRQAFLLILWNLSIADMLYNGHLHIADTSIKNKLKPTMVISQKHNTFYSRHLFLEPIMLAMEKFQRRQMIFQ